jgi:hypothetical protein
MFFTRKKVPRKGSVAETLQKNKNRNRNSQVAIEGAANAFLNAANATRNASNSSKKLRNTFNKLRFESEQVISSNKIDEITDKIYRHSDKSNIDNKLSLSSIMVLIQRGDIERAIAKLISGETPNIEEGSNLDVFFDTYNDIIQDIIKEVLKIPGLKSISGTQEGGGIEIAIAVSIVTLVLAAFLSKLFTDYFCKFTSYKNRKWCAAGFESPIKVPENTVNPLRVAVRNSKGIVNLSRTRVYNPERNR